MMNLLCPPPTLALITALAAPAAPAPNPSKLADDELLAAGRYSEIPAPRKNDAHGHALWAFARFYLCPDKTVADAASLAHQKGDDLGTYVWKICNSAGVGVIRNPQESARLNYELRQGLLKKAKPSPLELYRLSRCPPGERTGVFSATGPEEVEREKQASTARLKKAAELGFAQAYADLAEAETDPAKSFAWYRKAANLGLAEGKRYVGIDLMLGTGVAKDPVNGYAATLEAARRGDVYAMINLTVFHQRGMGVKRDDAAAQRWLRAAAASGHWYGHLEHGMAQLTGDYGTVIDPKGGRAALQKAVDTGNAEALQSVAVAYWKGEGLAQDGARAARFALAANRQGSMAAATILTRLYSGGLGQLQPDAQRARIWQRAGAWIGLRLLSDADRAQLQSWLKEVDPFAMKVE
jgi:TPR repeat protein